MCWARSFFSRMIEAQLATGATQDMRILIGSALLATPPNRPNAKALARANFMRRILSSRFRWACAFRNGELHSKKRQRLSGVQLILASRAGACRGRPLLRRDQ